MTELILRARRQPYFWIGLAGILTIVIWVIGELRPAFTRSPGFLWQVTTGLILLAALSYQWVLLFMRHFKINTHMRLHFLAHRWVGVGATMLFAIHAIRIGHTWTTLLAMVFFLTALTGLLNKEIVPYKSRALYLLWLGTHLTLSAIMVPLIAIHIWVALAYQ